MIHILSKFNCICGKALCKTDTLTGVVLWCANGQCASRIAATGIEGKDEVQSFDLLEDAMFREDDEPDNEISLADWREEQKAKLGEWQLETEKAERRP